MPPFDYADPPAEPPPGTPRPCVWRLAAVVYRVHRLGARIRCLYCLDPWPCAGRRLAERVLARALAATDWD